jgi:hypothetical protein
VKRREQGLHMISCETQKQLPGSIGRQEKTAAKRFLPCQPTRGDVIETPANTSSSSFNPILPYLDGDEINSNGVNNQFHCAFDRSRVRTCASQAFSLNTACPTSGVKGSADPAPPPSGQDQQFNLLHRKHIKTDTQLDERLSHSTYYNHNSFHQHILLLPSPPDDSAFHPPSLSVSDGPRHVILLRR